MRNLSNIDFKFAGKQFFYFIIGLVIIALLSFPVLKKFRKQKELGQEISTLKTEIAKLENKNTELNQMISYLESEEFIEIEARQKLNYRKEGEEMLIIKNEAEEGGQENANNSQAQKKYSKPQKWLKYFFN